MEIDPSTIGNRERYKILSGVIVPRPIAFVSTQSPDGRLNIAPYSFFNGVGSDPMTVLFCPANNADGSEKDTMINCDAPPRGLGQFVVNVVTEGYAARMAATAHPLAYGESEFELAGLTPAPSRVVTPPRLGESPVALECETLEIVRTNPGGSGGGNVVIGKVVWVHVSDEIIDAGYSIDHDKFKAIGRMAGAAYLTTRDRFDLPFGKAALEDMGKG